MTKYAIHTKWAWPNGVPSAETMKARHLELRSKTKAEEIIWFKIDENTQFIKLLQRSLYRFFF